MTIVLIIEHARAPHTHTRIPPFKLDFSRSSLPVFHQVFSGLHSWSESQSQGLCFPSFDAHHSFHTPGPIRTPRQSSAKDGTDHPVTLGPQGKTLFARCVCRNGGRGQRARAQEGLPVGLLMCWRRRGHARKTSNTSACPSNKVTLAKNGKNEDTKKRRKIKTRKLEKMESQHTKNKKTEKIKT